MSAPAAIIFDLDGTLVDSRLDLARSTNHSLRAVGLPARDEAEIVSFIGEGSRRLIELAVAPHADLLEPALAAWADHYATHLLEETRLYPGIAELLSRLQMPLAVHTNKPGHFAREILEGLGLASRFRCVIGGGDGPARKPDPEGARLILKTLTVSEDAARYVGDSRIDVATARAAAIPFIGVAWGIGGRAELVAAGAERIVDDVGELERVSVSRG